MKLFTLCSLALFFSSSSFSANFDLNDVSILFPLPTAQTASQYLAASDFIPRTWFTKNLANSSGDSFSVSTFTVASGSSAEYEALSLQSYQSIRLLAVRVDPCFHDLLTDPCRPQLRAVWQPLEKDGTSVDATLHTFYDFRLEELKALLTQLQALKTKYQINTAGLPLQVHPGFKIQGFSADLFALLKRWMPAERMTRIAFMKLLGREFQWSFLGFNIQNNQLLPISIPEISVTEQIFSTQLNGGIPVPQLPFNSEEIARIKSGVSRDKVLLGLALRAQNPRVSAPGNINCLACHASDVFQTDAARALQMNPAPTIASALGLIGKYDLRNTTASHQDRNHFRAFGYVFKNPSISDRVIFESARVADVLNQR